MKTARIISALVLTVCCAASLPAQEKKKKGETATTRIVQGTVTDADDKPVIDAVVQLKDLRTLQVRSFISQENGAYHFSELKLDDDYELRADHSGMSSGWKRLSVFDSRKQPVVNLKLDKKQEPEK